jgi:hypothetical protein
MEVDTEMEPIESAHLHKLMDVALSPFWADSAGDTGQEEKVTTLDNCVELELAVPYACDALPALVVEGSTRLLPRGLSRYELMARSDLLLHYPALAIFDVKRHHRAHCRELL